MLEWTELENEKANIMLLFYMDSIYWTWLHSCIPVNKKNFGWPICR